MKKPEPGIIMYSLKEGCENGEPAHNICADCYNKGQKSFLQMVNENGGRFTWKCNVCGFSAKTGRLITKPLRTGGWSASRRR